MLEFRSLFVVDLLPRTVPENNSFLCLVETERRRHWLIPWWDLLQTVYIIVSMLLLKQLYQALSFAEVTVVMQIDHSR